MHTRVVIVSGKRTPIGSLGGCLANLSGVELGAAAISAVLESLNVNEISEIIMGQALTAACGQNPARQAGVKAGVPYHVPAMTISKVCGSGLKSVMLGYQAILLGHADIVVAGGQESMSRASHAALLRQPNKMGNISMVDTMVHDGLTDAFCNYHMAITAENIAKRFSIERARQDAFAAESQRRVAQAQKDGVFNNEIAPIAYNAKGKDIVVDKDEHPRNDTTEEKLKALKPVFDPSGTVTAGNASGVNDGAAAVLMMSEQLAAKKEIMPMVHIESCAVSGVDPAYMGLGPVSAISKALAQARWSVEDVDLFELNEAFASQALAVIDELRLNPKIVNVNGGAIALGHPIGASGARCLVTLIHEMNRRRAHKGVVALCVGGGMGVAMCVSKSI